MPAATDALSDSAGPRIGIDAITSHAARTPVRSPPPSLPTTMATARSQSYAQTVVTSGPPGPSSSASPTTQ